MAIVFQNVRSKDIFAYNIAIKLRIAKEAKEHLQMVSTRLQS